MDWIKKNYDRFTLALFSAVLIGVAVMMFLNAGGFGERFSAALANPPHNNTIPAVDTAVIVSAKQQIENPTIWKERDPEGGNAGLLFTATRFQVSKDGVLSEITKGKNWRHSRLKGPDGLGLEIPNKWVLDHGFNPLEKSQAVQDLDGDGFWNEDEWLFNTDPKKKESHPPYHALLFLKKFHPVPFRLKFQAYDGNAKTDTPDKMQYQIDTIEFKQPTEFLKLGDKVPNTVFKLEKFQFKMEMNEKIGAEEEVSELTVRNTETDELVTLILGKVVDSPNYFAIFSYYVTGINPDNKPFPYDFGVQKLKPFVLKPEVDKRYKLLDVKPDHAVIQLPDGTTTYTVPLYPGLNPNAPAPPPQPPPQPTPPPPTPPAPTAPPK